MVRFLVILDTVYVHSVFTTFAFIFENPVSYQPLESTEVFYRLSTRMAGASESRFHWLNINETRHFTSK